MSVFGRLRFYGRFERLSPVSPVSPVYSSINIIAVAVAVPTRSHAKYSSKPSGHPMLRDCSATKTTFACCLVEFRLSCHHGWIRGRRL